MRFFEVITSGFSKDGRREGTEDLAMLNSAIQNFFHFRPPRVGDDAAIAERPRSPFRAVLKPAENFSIGDDLRSVAHEVRLSEFGDGITVARKGAGIDRVTHLVA